MVIEVDDIALGLAHRYWKKIANFKSKQDKASKTV